MHAIDREMILQACIFEAVYKDVENIIIPSRVFEDFGLEIENRCFRYEDMLFPEKPRGYVWGEDGGIPDISRQETRLWFYYRAVRYIDSGFEALHMGQVHLYTAGDRGFVRTRELFDRIREYAGKHGRRHKVLLDAHTHGININGTLLFDYHAMPFTRVPLLEEDGEKLVLVREGISEGGENPNGWSALTMPYLMEYDNWGGKLLDNFDDYTREQRAWMDWWGYDQIAWFASQDAADRNHFLEYTYKWTAVNNVNAYFEIPFRRTLTGSAMLMEGSDNEQLNEQLNGQDYYRFNTKSQDCPMGFEQEETVKRLWSSEDRLREKAGNPSLLLDYGAKEEYDPDTGIRLPVKVVVYGSFQPYAGAVKNDSNSEVTRMYYIGDNTYTLSVVIPYAGEYDYAVSTYGTLSATYCYDTYPRSGSGNKSFFRVEKDNTAVRFQYRFIDNVVTIEIFDF